MYKPIGTNLKILDFKILVSRSTTRNKFRNQTLQEVLALNCNTLPPPPLPHLHNVGHYLQFPK